MRIVLASLLFVVLATCAGASPAVDTGHGQPVKPQASVDPNLPDPDRQGGDTIAGATVIPAIPFYDTGTTTGYTDDYDEVCPYDGSNSPDVVYAYMPPGDLVFTIDMYGSSYDTKIYVYDEQLNLVACNDDYYPDYVSKLENVPLVGGVTYYIVVDGYGGDHGDYVFNIVEYVPCVLECPPGGMAEGEPPLVDDYVDVYNGGCNTPPGMDDRFQDLPGDDQGRLVFCAVSGWYLFEGSNYRDTDWFHVYAGDTGIIELTADAERPTFIFEDFQDCYAPVYLQHIEVGPCSEDTMILDYGPGARARLVVVPTTFIPPWPGFGHEFEYVIWFSGLASTPVTIETRNWTSVKALFR